MCGLAKLSGKTEEYERAYLARLKGTFDLDSAVAQEAQRKSHLYTQALRGENTLVRGGAPWWGRVRPGGWMSLEERLALPVPSCLIGAALFS